MTPDEARTAAEHALQAETLARVAWEKARGEQYAAFLDWVLVAWGVRPGSIVERRAPVSRRACGWQSAVIAVIPNQLHFNKPYIYVYLIRKDGTPSTRETFAGPQDWRVPEYLENDA